MNASASASASASALRRTIATARTTARARTTSSARPISRPGRIVYTTLQSQSQSQSQSHRQTICRWHSSSAPSRDRTSDSGSRSYHRALFATAGLLLLLASGSGCIRADAAAGSDLVSPSAAGDPGGKLIPMSEVEAHNSLSAGIWVVINGQVYDLTTFVQDHPGGSKIILKNAGKDVTDLFMPVHPSNTIEEHLTPEQYIGQVDPSTVTIVNREESESEKKRRLALENLPPVESLLNLDDFELQAQKILTDQAWAYYSSAGDDEVTLQGNRDSFGRIWFKPRVLRPVGTVSTAVKVLDGKVESSLPIYISPAAMAKLGHPDGELNLTRAAGQEEIIQGVSANASVSLDEILSARKEGQPIIYQLYINKDRSASERILQKVESRGCTAVMLTVDAAVMGKRERDMRAKGGDDNVSTGDSDVKTSGTSGGKGVASAISGYIDPNLTWDDIRWYTSHCSLPLFLKGVQTVEDVALAYDHGVHGVVLSNHGGRSLDYSRPSIDVLIDLAQQRPDLVQNMEIWLDGGVRRGTDVLKAYALGAKNVGLGRPFLYGQSGYGQRGAQRVIEILRDEIERGLRLLGVSDISQLGPEMIEVLPRVYVPPQRQHSMHDI
ncbi:unnamed protein product [Sympodiomycopsis kandeliae]